MLRVITAYVSRCVSPSVAQCAMPPPSVARLTRLLSHRSIYIPINEFITMVHSWYIIYLSLSFISFTGEDAWV